MKLSIITINFNNCDGLQKTIDSVIAQTWRDFEWIVIDGGSTDGSKELIEKYQNHFTYWCSEPDKGIYNAMNKGIDHALGDYVFFLNSGDCFHDQDVIMKVFGLGLNADIISGNVVRMDNGKPVRTYNENVFIQIISDTLNHQGTFIKRQLFEKTKYDEELKIVSDWKFWLEAIVWSNASVAYINITVAVQDMTGITFLPSQNQSLERDKVLKELFPPLLLNEIKKYCLLSENEYNVRGKYLLDNNLFVYKIGRQFLSILVRIVKLFVY